MNWFGRQKLRGHEEVHEWREAGGDQRQVSPPTRPLIHKMRAAPPLLLLLLLVALIPIVAGGKNKEKNKPSQYGSECTDWRYGNCVPSNGDCGAGFREGSCDQQTNTMKCKVPCNWKKDFGADCKYRFGSWGHCDPSSGSRTRTGTLKRALYDAECQQTISVSKPCQGKPRKQTKARLTSSQLDVPQSPSRRRNSLASAAVTSS